MKSGPSAGWRIVKTFAPRVQNPQRQLAVEKWAAGIDSAKQVTQDNQP